MWFNRISAALGGRKEVEELVRKSWQWGMLSAGLKDSLELVLDVGPLVTSLGAGI